MSNAKKCDICGKYYDVPDAFGMTEFGMNSNTSMIQFARRKTDKRLDHEVIQFDTCEECYQDMLDYILAKGALVLIGTHR